MAYGEGHRRIQPGMVPARVPPPRRVRDWIATGVAAVVLLGTMVPFAETRAAIPTLTPQTSTAVAGDRIEVRGEGFTPRTRVTLRLAEPDQLLGLARAGANGSFRTRVTVPRVTPGRYTMLAMQVPTAPLRTRLTSAVVASAVLLVAISSPASGSAAPAPLPSGQPAPTPTPTPTATPTATPTPTPTPTAAPTPLPTPFPVPPTPPPPLAAPAPPAPAPPPADPAPPPPAPNPPIAGFVYRNGTDLALNGAPYRFTGFNIYNANSRWNCWYPMVGGGLDRALSDIGAGAEVFRAWFFQSLATSNGARDWSAFDATLATARAHGVRVVVTLSDHWGACDAAGLHGEAWYTSGYANSIYPGDITTYRQFVQEVVARYSGDPTVLMWQMVNEAESKRPDGSCSSVSVLSNFAADIGSLIKSIDGNHLVSLGTMGGGQCATAGGDFQTLHSLSVIDVCEVHDYWDNAPLPGDQWNGLQVRINQCNALGKPLFVGELGRQPQAAGGTIQARADIFGAKIVAQLGAGADGVLLWGWRNGDQGGSAGADYDIGPGDPVLVHVRGN